MAGRLDIILFGATGFTGKHTIPVLHKLTKANGRSLTWGVSGRSEEKLKQILQELSNKDLDLTSTPIIVADINDEASLKVMAEKAKVVINCCGPYRFLGDVVVKACIDAGTHHVDVSGEPQYMERMQLEHNEEAKERGVYVVSACGFDSIPTDLGVVYLQNNFEGTLNSVVSYLEGESPGSGSILNYATWESAVYGLAHFDELRGLRSKLYPERFPKFEPKLQPKSLPHKSEHVDGWVVPFMGSDRSVIRRSQRYFYDAESKRPVQIETYIVWKSFCQLLTFVVFGSIFVLLCKFEFGRKLLLKYPKLFSGGMFNNEQPNEDRMNRSSFSVTLYGEGWKEKLTGPDDKYTKPVDKSIMGKVSGMNPGYGATCVALVLSGIMTLTESDKMPGKGGVYPPGAAFAKTTLIKQLNENGIKFEIISQKEI